MNKNNVFDISQFPVSFQALIMESLAELGFGSSDEVIEVKKVKSQQERSNTALFQDDSSSNSEDSEVRLYALKSQTLLVLPLPFDSHRRQYL